MCWQVLWLQRSIGLRPVAYGTWDGRADTLTIICVDLLHHLDLGQPASSTARSGLQLLPPPNVIGPLPDAMLITLSEVPTAKWYELRYGQLEDHKGEASQA